MGRPVGPWYLVNVEALVRRADGRYLLVVRGPGETHAAGTLSIPGGKVEMSELGSEVLEATARRELLEEVGIEIHPSMHYLESKAFVTDDGEPVVDVVFLCTYQRGEATILQSEEVAEVLWLTPAEAAAHPCTPPWTRQSVEKAERWWRDHGGRC